MSEDMVFCFKCLMLAENYVRIPNITNIHRLMKKSLGKKAERPADGIAVWLEIILKVVTAMNTVMRDIKFFADNPKYRGDVLDFVIQKHFTFTKNLSDYVFAKYVTISEIQNFFYNALNNPKLDKYSDAKNIVAAYLFTHRALRI